MGRNPHPDYFYKIKSDLSFEQVSESELLSNIDDVLFIVKTIFVENKSEFTFSRHQIYDSEMNLTCLAYGDTRTLHDQFSDYFDWPKLYNAAVVIQIKDSLGNIRDKKFYHPNGLDAHNSDINGEGINSVIEVLKFMKTLNNKYFANWKFYEQKRQIAENFIHMFSWSDGESLEEAFNLIFEESDDSFYRTVCREWSDKRQEFLNKGLYDSINEDWKLEKRR